jgi:hypothetical protein
MRNFSPLRKWGTPYFNDDDKQSYTTSLAVTSFNYFQMVDKNLASQEGKIPTKISLQMLHADLAEKLKSHSN